MKWISSRFVGDSLYKCGDYADAAEVYTMTLSYENAILDEAIGDVRASVLASRAACYLMLAQNSRESAGAHRFYHNALKDCEASMKIMANAKAAVRQGAARLALGDIAGARFDCAIALSLLPGNDMRMHDVARVSSACDELEAALAQLRWACAPQKSLAKPQQFFRVALRIEAAALAAAQLKSVCRHLELGCLAEAALYFHSGDVACASTRLDAALGGSLSATPPGGAPPHRSALYALRARCALRAASNENEPSQRFLSAARDDVSRAATAIGGASVTFLTSLKDRLQGCAAEDSAYLVRLRARCDLLSARVAATKHRRPHRKLCVEIAAAIATLEARGSSTDCATLFDIDGCEADEIAIEVKRADDLVRTFVINSSNDRSSGSVSPIRPPPSVFQVYDDAYRRFESETLASAADASISLSELPLPPDDTASGAVSSDPPDKVKALVRTALLRWHPDKAATFAHKFLPKDRDLLIKLSASITRRIILEKRNLLRHSVPTLRHPSRNT